MLVIDSQGEIVTINRAACEILGYTGDTFRGKGWGEIFFEADKNVEFNQVIIEVILEKQVNLHRDVSYIRPTGETLRLSINTSFLQENDEIVGLVVLLDDVTELHGLHEREKAILEEKNRAQRERTESLKKLALAVAHQIRNPVTSIGGFATRLLNKSDKKDGNAVYLRNILSGTKRLEAIVQGVMDYTEISPASPVKVPILRTLGKAQARLTEKAAELSKQVNWNVKIEPIEVLIDPELFAQALDEILLNCVEAFTDDHGTVDIIAFRNGNGTHIEISGTGTGISEQDMPYIFDPFFTTKAVGVGMGLCKAQRIITEHKGELTVSSSTGKGTKVTVHLPRC